MLVLKALYPRGSTVHLADTSPSRASSSALWISTESKTLPVHRLP
ncbi:Uncharacterised protein [Vibrio cholerae]|nr:Uncharacterised protein [Vibrio cholerae]